LKEILISPLVRLRSGPYAEDWVVTSTIWLDAGQLNAVARAAAAFSSGP
jgi:hypothetical protein